MLKELKMTVAQKEIGYDLYDSMRDWFDYFESKAYMELRFANDDSYETMIIFWLYEDDLDNQIMEDKFQELYGETSFKYDTYMRDMNYNYCHIYTREEMEEFLK